jgi:chloramphenicol 3-O-phosphotransferase
MRDWIIDCAVRWQRRNKLVVPRAGAVSVGASVEVPAVIGPREAALKALWSSAQVPVELPLAATVPVEPIAPAPVAVAEPEAAPLTFIETAPTLVEPTPDVPEMAEPMTEQTKTIPMPEPTPSPAPAPIADAPAERPMADVDAMSAWQVLILSGPAGSGKSSIAQQFCEMLPRSVHIKVEPLRDRSYSVLVAQPMAAGGHEAGAKAEVWSGKTEEAREQAADLAAAYIHTGYHVIIDDVIEAPTELKLYQDGLSELDLRIVTLMPSLEELERRDKMRPVEAQAGSRIKEFHANMVRQLSAHSSVLDTSHETVQETVQRILDLLKKA